MTQKFPNRSYLNQKYLGKKKRLTRRRHRRLKQNIHIIREQKDSDKQYQTLRKKTNKDVVDIKLTQGERDNQTRIEKIRPPEGVQTSNLKTKINSYSKNTFETPGQFTT